MLLVNVHDHSANNFIYSWHWKDPITKSCHKWHSPAVRDVDIVVSSLLELINVIFLSESGKLEYAHFPSLFIQILADIYKYRYPKHFNKVHHLRKLFPPLSCASSHFQLQIPQFYHLCFTVASCWMFGCYETCMKTISSTSWDQLLN